MADGVVVDPLTSQFLQIARDPVRLKAARESLGGFLLDTRDLMNQMKQSLFLAGREIGEERGEIWSELGSTYRGLELLVERVHTLCLTPSLACLEADLGSWLEVRRADWVAWFSRNDRGLGWHPPDVPAHGRFDPRLLIEALDSLLGWRADSARAGDAPTLAWWLKDGEFVVRWNEPSGRIGDVADSSGTRSGALALAILDRAIRAHRGWVSISESPGLEIRMTWPANGGAVAR